MKDRERGRHEPNCDRGESKWIDGYASPFIFLAGPTQHPHTPRARSTRQIGVILFLAPRSVTSSRAFAYSHYRASAVRSNAVMPVSALRSVWVANSTSRECLSLSLSLFCVPWWSFRSSAWWVPWCRLSSENSAAGPTVWYSGLFPLTRSGISPGSADNYEASVQHRTV